MPHDLRCPSRKHAVLVQPGSGIVEFKCSSDRCGAGKGVVVLHQFDVSTGELINTNRFRTP